MAIGIPSLWDIFPSAHAPRTEVKGLFAAKYPFRPSQPFTVVFSLTDTGTASKHSNLRLRLRFIEKWDSLQCRTPGGDGDFRPASGEVVGNHGFWGATMF